MIDLFDSLCSVMKKKSVFILLVSLLIISGVNGQGNLTITLSNNLGMVYSMLPPNINTADVTILTQNVILQANMEGRWNKSGETISTTNTIAFDVITRNLAGLYEFLSVEDTLAIQIKISAIGSNFAELTSSNKYTLLSGNNVFYTDTTLVCVTSDTSVQPVWTYRKTQQVVDTILTGVNWDDSTGISRLDIVTTQQGYYTCTVTGVQSYNVAIFNPDVTTIATDGQQYTYTNGIDSSNIQLLCTSDSNTALSSIRWGIFPNPMILQTLQIQESTISCRVGFSTVLQVVLLVQGPPQITLSTTSDTYAELINSGIDNTAEITVLSKNVMLQVNIRGRWELPDGSSNTESAIEFELFTKDLAGMYKLYVSSWEGSEVLAIQIEINAVGTNFAEIISQGIYSILSGNEVFYADTTLACATSGIAQPQWSYKDNQLANDVTQLATTWIPATGISTLSITTTQQGYYTCTPIAEETTYTAAIFNPDVTIIATNGQKYTYTKDIDPPDIQILCTTTDSNTALNDIQWKSYNNPQLLASVQNQNITLICETVSTTILQVDIVVQGPPQITLSTTSNTYTELPNSESVNTADIKVLSKNVLLQVDIKGRWELPDGSSNTENIIEFELFTKDLAGVYKFYVSSWDGSEVLAIQIEISAVGTNFAEITSQGIYSILSGNEVFYADTTLACVTSGTSQPQWSYKDNQLANDVSQSSTIWDSTTGISTLTITTTQQGYYTCTPIAGGVTYTIAIFNPDVTIIATNGQKYTYTKDIDPSDIQILCTTTDSNTALSDIKWGNSNNPLVLTSLQNQNITLSCTDVTILRVDLVIQGPPVLTLSTTSDTYTELPNSEIANTADINVLSKNVMLQVDIKGRWELPDGSSNTESVIEFELFTKDLAGVYKFYVSSWDGSEVLAIQIEINAVGTLAEESSQGIYSILSGNEVFYADTTLACVTIGTSQPQWSYKDDQLANDVTQLATTWNSITGISTLTITTTQQGYYTCTPIAEGVTYTVAIFNLDVTIIATDGQKYTYTKDIDPSDIQILCTTTDSNTALSEIQWKSYNNPLLLASVQNQDKTLICRTVSTTLLQVDIVVQGPPQITLSTTSNIYAEIPNSEIANTADIKVLSKNVMLQVDIKGRWELPDGSSYTESVMEFELFTKDLAGVYKFYVNSWDGSEVLAIQIEISAVGTNFAEITSQGIYSILSGNEVFYADTTLACATSGIAQPQWSYKDNQLANDVTQSSTTWDSTTGISTLTITTTQQGYYTCTPIAGGTTYTAAIFNPDVTINATNGQKYTYTKDIELSDIQLLCTTTDSNTALSNIKWGSSNNPLNLASLLNQDRTLSCRTQSTDVTILQVDIVIQGPPVITLSTTPGTNYALQPKSSGSNRADITILSQNVTLEVNLEGRWKLGNVPLETGNLTEIELFTKNSAGLYMFHVTSWDNSEVVAIQIEISAVGTNFAEITSQGLYKLLSGNEVFYADTTLACATSGANEPQWSLKENQDASSYNLTATSWDSTTGISTLDITKTQQGYYTCTPISGTTYIVSIYNLADTIVANIANEIQYTNGTDLPQLKLLCRPATGETEVSWESSSIASTLQNPFTIISELNSGENILKCMTNGIFLFTYTVFIQGPPRLTIINSTSVESYTNMVNNASFRVFTQNISLGINLRIGSYGRWDTPIVPEITSSSTMIPIFTADLAGSYKFHVTNYLNTDMVAIQIQISATGSNFAELTSSDEYTLLSGNNIFYTDTTLVCVTSNTSIQPVWIYRETQGGRLKRPTGVIWDVSTGISRLDIVTTEQGYYTCTITGVQTYNVAIFKPDVTTNATDGQRYTYTKGIDSSDTQLLCRPDSNTALSNIRWGNLSNPLVLQSLQIQESIITCIVGSSTILQVNLLVQGPPQITLSTTSDTYTELHNSGNANTADIKVLSKNVMLQVNITGRWELPDGSSNTESVIELELFTKDLAGMYKFYVSSWDGSEVLAIHIEIFAVGTNFAEITSEGIYSILSGNKVFFADTTLACASSGIAQPQWSYKDNQLANDVSQSSTTWIPATGISTLTITTTQQGYYTCTPIAGETTYTVAIFNPDVTVEVTIPDIKAFTRVIDSPQLQLLCRSSDTNIPLDDIQWTSRLDISLSIPNPFIVRTLSNGNHYLECNNGSTPFNSIIIVQGPPTLTITDTFSTSYTLLPPEINTADITVFSQNILLEVNLVTQNSLGRWVTPHDPEITTTSTTISEFTANLAGLYTFYVINFLSNEELAIQIKLALVGTAFLTVSDGKYEKLQNNSIINMTDTIMLACATSNTSNTEDRVSWYFQENSTSSSKKEMSELNDITGLSVFKANKSGYYHCYVKDHNGDMMRYYVGLIELSEHTIPIIQEVFMISEPRSFTIGEPLQYYYRNESIPITAIRWGIDPSDNEDTDREFYNPVSINDVFNSIGSGAIQLSCFYRQSPVTIIGDISIDMKDNESLTIEYDESITDEGITKTFSDLTNPNFPVPQNIDIKILSKNVKFSCNLSTCEVLEGNSSTPINLLINTIRIEHDGTYSLSRMTGKRVNYTTAPFTLTVTGFIKQNIVNIYSSVINANSANITWDLLTNDLPDNADQTFNITYQRDGGEVMFAGDTQDAFFYIPDLTAGVTYTVWVELSYAYTIVKDKMSIQVVIQIDQLILIIILVVVVLILLLVAIAVILLILCIWKFRSKSDKKFRALKSDENELEMEPPVRSSRDFQYAPISPPIDNLANNPVLTESLPKFNQSASRDNRNYQNLQDVKDPRMKPIPLEMYKKTIDKLWEDENALENEYKSLGGDILRYECRNAQFDQNRIKNKYKFIYPYDKSRVVLKKIGKDVHSDYINASHIPGTYVTENFIAAQGPKVNTIQDVWRMVFEQNIRNIVMVTNCIEGGKLKCEEYFPSKDGKTNEYEQYKVKTVSMTQDVGHITRVLKIQSPTESIQVKHFHFTAWPDHDVPSLHDELLQFIGYVQENITQSEAPILVHCSAGVGRTGTFITLFNLRAEILKRQPISIYHLVNEMREHRPHMVQTFRQYKFIYLAVLELLLDNTSIPADEFSNTYQNYLKSDQTGYVSVFYQQFSELNYQCEKSFEYATDNGGDNEEKNPIPDILPYDNNRVVIYSPHFECGYINASYHENNLFITTLHPTANTLLDFLQMIYQTDATLVVMLSTAKEKAKIQGNMSDRKPYWPNKDVPLEVPPFQVEVVNSEKSTSMVKQKIILRNLQESSEREFTQVISTSWTEKSDLTDLPSVLNLLHTIIHHRQEYPNGTIIMHCADSISKTGIMFTVYQCIQEMERSGKVDIFHTVKRLRRERMKLIPELAQFLACFSLMNEYCSSK